MVNILCQFITINHIRFLISVFVDSGSIIARVSSLLDSEINASGTRVPRAGPGGLHIIVFMINFNLAACTWTQHTAAQAVLTHVHVIKTCTRTLYKLHDSLIGLHCCRSEVLRRLASELWHRQCHRGSRYGESGSL